MFLRIRVTRGETIEQKQVKQLMFDSDHVYAESLLRCSSNVTIYYYSDVVPAGSDGRKKENVSNFFNYYDCNLGVAKFPIKMTYVRWTRALAPVADCILREKKK